MIDSYSSKALFSGRDAVAHLGTRFREGEVACGSLAEARELGGTGTRSPIDSRVAEQKPLLFKTKTTLYWPGVMVPRQGIDGVAAITSPAGSNMHDARAAPPPLLPCPHCEH